MSASSLTLADPAHAWPPQRVAPVLHDLAARVAAPVLAAPGPRRGVVAAAMLGVHVVLLAALLNSAQVREQVRERVPLFLAILPVTSPPPAPRPLPAPPRAALAPTPVPMPVVVAEAEPVPVPTPTPPAKVAAVAPAAPLEAAPVAPAPAPAPRVLPASAVQYLVAPAPVYSRTSARLKEAGRVVVRVWIDEGGLPRDAQVATSSGYARLDDSAVSAVRLARFKPCMENGVAVAGWALIPIEFELPR